jgi:molecular chaperone GrpE
MTNANSQSGGNDTPETQPPADPASVAASADAGDNDFAQRFAALEAMVETLRHEKLMALAEAENAAKRADKRIADNARYAVANICKALLQVADNLGRALLAAPANVRATNEALKNLAAGVELTEKELVTVLENQGVRRVDALNQPFDAHLHNAIQEVENTTVPAGTVVQVFQDGYMMHDRLLRPAMVVVSKGGPKREPASAAPASTDRTV